ncbi:hypothetical protein ACFFJT_05390 [Dyella flava]|uniref:DUF5610 domain-containing protein n=1 Tax=Dyella flava TaxID=1920170 RepID=A0ABS2K8Z8_9GAMM|nr:hypothetical protein [Dyella flava]MBM7126788.1 hypothetical protein [Dyella flava]GLQ49387.1 hypothetical protein GCM10010872_08360 [Dyella flava]
MAVNTDSGKYITMPDGYGYQDADYGNSYRDQGKSILEQTSSVIGSAAGTIYRPDQVSTAKANAGMFLGQLQEAKARILAGDPTASIDAQYYLGMFQDIMKLAEAEQEGESSVNQNAYSLASR